jgi:hypothetical protein
MMNKNNMKRSARSISDIFPPSRSLEYAYNMGIDYVLNGANETNCHFSIFMSPENVRAWERGKTDAEVQIDNPRT